MRVSLALPTVLLTALSISATPIGSPVARANGDTAKYLAEKPNLTFEKYGPQGRARAIRASLKAALAPDPLSIGALLFCAFALRWMRMRNEQARTSKRAMETAHTPLPGAA